MERKLTQLEDKALSRRGFMAGAGAVAAGAFVTGCSGGDTLPLPPSPVGSTGSTGTTGTTGAYKDSDILNFALNLEYLEAEFYLRAATGSGLSVGDTGNLTSQTTGGAMVAGLSPTQQQYINEVAQNELDHVRFLRSALGTAAVSAPTIDLTNSFNALAMAAGLGSTFNPFSSYDNFLIGAFIFEDVGVTAYHGAAPLLVSKTILTAAAQIHAVEAYHAASIRSQIVGTSASLVGIANAVSAVRASLGGPMETMLSPTTIVAADSNSLGYARSTSQVLHIVYGTGGGAGVKSGAFFPNGLNGYFTATTA